MQFQSFIFIQFFILVYTAYLLLSKNFKAQNILLLIASYIFYGYWDWRFLLLLFTSTSIDFVISKNIYKTDNRQRRKLLLMLSIFANLSILGFFKYFNFFASSFVDLLNLIGIQADDVTIKILLPVGISFYTFQTLSYTIDVYRGQLKPADKLHDFALYLSFFPQLVAGPIERATHLLPQIISPRKIELAQVNAGIFLILWGYFKKLVIADNLSQIANPIFDNYSQYQGLDLVIGILAFTIQIYCDFSAYSDIARGLAKLMGFDLMVNFKLPFFAINPSDFWARWHISLSTWLRDYLYIPLGGNRQGELKTHRNLFITMLLGGLWHGAAWNFVIWGAYQGAILVIYRIFDHHPEHLDPWSGKYPYHRVLGKMLVMFILANIGWVIFRSSSPSQISYILTNLGLQTSDRTFEFLYNLCLFACPLLIVQFFQYISRDLLIVTKLKPIFYIPIYGFILTCIFIFALRESVEFIYFQF
jgi:D-alanyl-lipoteichoic acid acyltransferase DltB (MBOAT superfamily)